MLDQPELTPEWEAYLKQSTPPDIGSKGNRKLVQRSEELPDQEGFALLNPHRTPISRRPRCLMPNPSTVPEPLPPVVPVTEETDLRVQQVPWEGVM